MTRWCDRAPRLDRRAAPPRSAVLAGGQLRVGIDPLVLSHVERLRPGDLDVKFSGLVEKFDAWLAALGGHELAGAGHRHTHRVAAAGKTVEPPGAFAPARQQFAVGIVTLNAVPARVRHNQTAVGPRDREKRLGNGEPPALAAGDAIEHFSGGADAPNGTAAAVGRKNRPVLRHGQTRQRGALGQALGFGQRFAVEIAEQHPIAKADD